MKLLNFVKKRKYQNLEPKMPYLSNFGIEFQKTIVIFEISILKFVKNESLTHTVNFGIESAFFKGPGPLFLKVPFRVWVRFIKLASLTN